MRGGHAHALVQDLLHFGGGDGADVYLEEAVAEGAGEGLTAPVGAPRGVLCGEEAEGRVGADDFLVFCGGGGGLGGREGGACVCVYKTSPAQNCLQNTPPRKSERICHTHNILSPLPKNAHCP